MHLSSSYKTASITRKNNIYKMYKPLLHHEPNTEKALITFCAFFPGTPENFKLWENQFYQNLYK